MCAPAWCSVPRPTRTFPRAKRGSWITRSRCATAAGTDASAILEIRVQEVALHHLVNHHVGLELADKFQFALEQRFAAVPDEIDPREALGQHGLEAPVEERVVQRQRRGEALLGVDEALAAPCRAAV